MSATLFAIARPDGRSNQQVLLDYVRDHEPGRLYSFGELTAVLETGSPATFPPARVVGVVGAARRRLLKEQRRTLISIRGTGFRLAQAGEHSSLALVHRRRADSQIERGLRLLRHVRWDEMDENQRTVHHGTFLVMEAIYQNQKSAETRQSHIESAIEDLKAEVARLSAIAT